MAEVIDFKTRKPLAQFNDLSPENQNNLIYRIGMYLNTIYGFEYIRSLLNEQDRKLIDEDIKKTLKEQNKKRC